MALKTGRAFDVAQIEVDFERCTHCGICADSCKGEPLFMDQGRLAIDQTRLFGCIGCGQCVAVCPLGCIEVIGRDLKPEDTLPMPGEKPGYVDLMGLLLSRRSVRNYRNKEVEREKIEQILAATATAPMGLPPSDVEVLVLAGRDKVQEFAADMVAAMRKQRWLFTPLVQKLISPISGKESAQMFSGFVLPLIDVFSQGRKKGEDWLLYDAPLALYFHSSPYSEQLDPVIAATYAMLTAHSLGLGTCLIGFPAPFMKHNPKLKAKYGIAPRNHQGIMLIAGYAAYKYQRAIKRRLAKVHWY